MNETAGIWTQDLITALTRLWSDGHSATEIGRRLSAMGETDFTKNAVIGKVHRLGLPARPSPIKARTVAA